MNNDNFMIEQEDLSFAQDICKNINDDVCRARAVSNILAVNLAFKFFDENSDIDIKSGIHNSSEILEAFDIADFYFNGNYIDARIYFDDNNLTVPEANVKMGILPTAYMFIKVDEDLENAMVTGFLLPEDIDNTNVKDGYYNIDETSLVSFYDVESRCSTVDDTELSESFEENVFEFLDKRLDDKTAFIESLLKSKYARTYFLQASKANYILGEFDPTNDSAIVNDISDNITLESENEVSLNIEPETDSLVLDTNNEIQDLITDESDDSLTLDLEDGIESITPLQADDFEPLISDEEVLEIKEVTDDDLPNDMEFENNALFEDNNSAISLNISDTEISQELSFENQITDDNQFGENEVTDSDKLIDEYTNELSTLDEEKQEEGLPLQDVHPDTENDTENINLMSDEEKEDVNLVLEDTPFEYSTEITPNNIEKEPLEDNDINDNVIANEQIDTLFSNSQEKTSVNINKKKSPIIPILGLAILLAGAGYFGYTKFQQSNTASENLVSKDLSYDDNKTVRKTNTEPAMPIETVEKVNTNETTNEAVAVSIPSIEQNLDMSIEIENLSVTWEVPTGYMNNTSAKNYFTRLGKVLQLNLKTELLLSSSPPITNKIAIELEFDKATGKFKVKDMVCSSGSSSVDTIIKNTVAGILNKKFDVNMQIFKDLQGNPQLIIKL